jgi:hypothetical protein
MPRYFFHGRDGRTFKDDEGTELPDDASARIEAARVLGQLVNEWPSQAWEDDPFQITVTDETGLTVFVLDLAAIAYGVKPPIEPPPAEGSDSPKRGEPP